MNNCHEVPRGALLETLIDYRGKTPPKSGAGVKLITAKVIKDGRIDRSRLEYISEATYEAWMHRGLPRKGDILVTTEAPLGEVAQLRADERVALAQRVILLRPHVEKVDPQFLFHFLRSSQALARLRQRSSGTTVMGIRQPELRAVMIPVLGRSQQAACAALLDGFDDLIEINERRIELLEDLARSLYQEWFVRFRFPGHEGVEFVDSDLGPVPEGWRFRRLGDVAVIDKGLSYKGAHLTGAGDPMANLKCLKPSGGFRRGGTKPYSGGYKQRHAIAPGDLVVANTDLTQVGNVIGSPAIVPRRDFEQGGLLSHHLFAVRPLDGPAVPFLFHVLAHDRFRNFARERASGTTVLGLRPADIADYAFADPPAALRNLFTQFAAVVNDFSDGLEDQNENLAATRDLLLPRLVTGRLDISDIDLGVLLPSSAA